jgi:hypothetical protein
MIRKTATLITSFGCGVVLTLLAQGHLSSSAIAQEKPQTNADLLKRIQVIEGRLGTLESQQAYIQPSKAPPSIKPPPPPQQFNLPPLKMQSFEQYVRDWLNVLRNDDKAHGAQLASLSAQVSGLSSQQSNLNGTLSALQTRFNNHYHTMYFPGTYPLADWPIIVCNGYGSVCTAGTDYHGAISVPVFQPAPPSPGGNSPTSGPVNGPPPQQEIAKRPSGLMITSKPSVPTH